MYFTNATFHKLPNGEWATILYASRKHYGNAIGVNKGICLEETNRSFIQLARFVLKHHTRLKKKKLRKPKIKTLIETLDTTGEPDTITQNLDKMIHSEGFHLGYHISHKAHYKEVIRGREIMIGLYHEDGGCKWEFKLRWVSIGSNEVPRLDFYSDSWEAFASAPEFFKAISKLENPTEEELLATLKECEFKDLTKY